MFSAYNFYEIQQLSSEVDSLKQNQRHTITSIKALAEAAKTMQGNFEKLANETRKIEARVTLRSLENQIMDAAQMGVIRANEYVAHINMMSQGLYTALSGKLSPLLVDPESLQTALANMTNVAQAKGYNAISTVLPHIFELPSSLYVHAGRQTVDSIVHVPLVALASRRILYKRTDIPFILPFNMNDVDPELQHRDQEHAVWSIKQTGNYVATNKASSISYELKGISFCMQYCALQNNRTFAILFNDGLTPSSARVYKHFCPKPSQATFAQNSDASTEEERLNILEQVKKDLHKKVYIANYVSISVPDRCCSLKVTKY